MSPIVSKNIRVRHPDHFLVGPDSIVDDYCYFSARVVIGSGSHVAAGCSMAGGVKYLVTLGDFSSLSAGVRIWCRSNDFVNDVVAIVPEDMELDANPVLAGDVRLDNYTGVGSNAVIMPNTVVGEGATVGALSFVPPGSRLEPWWVYAGVPARKVRPRNRDRVLRQVEQLRAHLANRGEA